MSPGAVVLCGGESRRMGSPKAWLPFGPERLLQRVVRLVGAVAAPIVVVAAPGQLIPELPAEVGVVRDPIVGRGPLQGLATGFAALPGAVELAFATATDVPFLEPRWIARLADLIGDRDLAIPFVGQEYHPLAALYRKSTVLPVIEGLLGEGRLKVKGLVDLVRTRVVEVDDLLPADPFLGTLRNLNHPEEYDRALREAKESGQPGPPGLDVIQG